MHLEGVLENVGLVERSALGALKLGLLDISKQLVSVGGVGTLVDHLSRSLLGREASEIGQTLLSNDNVQIVLGLVDVGGEGDNARDTEGIGLGGSSGGSVHDGELSVSEEITGASQTMQHLGAVDTSGVGVGVDVNLDGGVHGDDTESSDDLGVVGHNLGSQQQLLGELVPVVEESLEAVLGQTDGGGSGEVEVAGLEEVQEGILQHLGPDVKVLEGGISQTLDDGVGNVTDTGLERQQVFGQSAGLDLLLEELNEVGSNGLRALIGRRVGTNNISKLRLDDGNDLEGSRGM